jgi:hypothetical protein
LLEVEPGFAGEEARHGGLTGARWAPEDQGAERAGAQKPGQRAVRANKVILPDDLGERGGPQPVGERTRGVAVQAAGGEEVGHTLPP